MSDAFWSQSTNSSRYPGLRNTIRAQFRSASGSCAQSPKTAAAIRFQARTSVRRPTTYAGTLSNVSISCRIAVRTCCGRADGFFLCCLGFARCVRCACSAPLSRRARAMASSTSADTFRPLPCSRRV
jgi:hypothetical protein